jgi:hypothetical protein
MTLGPLWRESVARDAYIDMWKGCAPLSLLVQRCTFAGFSFSLLFACSTLLQLLLRGIA